MIKAPLSKLAIRTAITVQPDIGYIYACDPRKEEKGTPHTYIFKWKAGDFARVECDYNVHSACIIKAPEGGRVIISEPGYYAVETRKGVFGGDIIEESQPTSSTKRVGGFRSVVEIEGKAYAVGYQGMVYRLDKPKLWVRIDDGLPGSFDIDAIQGFDESEIYACGLNGELWLYNGKRWSQCELPTDANLTSVECAGDGKVYVAGDKGVLICGRTDAWKVIDHGETDEGIWDLQWFKKKLYVSANDCLYRLERDQLIPIDFGKDKQKSFYQLSAAKGVMWSIGEEDIMSFDGKQWTRIV